MSIGEKFLYDKCQRSEFNKYNGRAFEWILIEVLVFTFFLFSMVILMFKSRFMKVGIDNSAQFEPVYMRILAQKIADSIPLNIEYAEQFYCGSERIIQVENVAFKICLNKQDYDKIQAKEGITD